MASEEITNEIILEHLQSMKLDFGKKFDSIDLRFDKMEKQIKNLRTDLKGDIAKLDERMRTLLVRSGSEDGMRIDKCTEVARVKGEGKESNGAGSRIKWLGNQETR